MKSRLLSALAVVVLTTSVATACTPGASPSPSPTPTFSTEAEAFAAAEETYRAYVDAVVRRWAAPTSGPDPQDFLIGTALENDIAARRRFEEEGIRLEGESRIESMVLVSGTGEVGFERLTATVCTDSSNVRVVNDAGEDVTPIDRPNPPLEVVFTLVNGQFLISESNVSEQASC